MGPIFTEKENRILEKAEDAILRKFEEALNSGEPLSDDQFASLMDGVRVLDRVCRMKYHVNFSQPPMVSGTPST